MPDKDLPMFFYDVDVIVPRNSELRLQRLLITNSVLLLSGVSDCEISE